MTTFSSNVTAIEALRFNPIPSKPLAVSKAVRVGETTTFVDDKGRLYSTGVKDRVHYCLGTQNMRLENALRGAMKLGCVSKEAVAEHEAHNALVNVERKRRWAADALQDNAKELGLQLTKAQLKRIDEAKHHD